MTVRAWVLAVAIVVNVAVFVGLLSSSRRVRGGQLDLTAAAARGELDLHWDWPPRGDDEGITPIPTETLGLLGREA